MSFIRVNILGLSPVSSIGGAFALMLGEEGGSKVLNVIIGILEAQAIAMKLNNMTPPRPTTHDLFCNSIKLCGMDIQNVAIDDLKDGTYYAKIRCTLNGKKQEIDSRPSDAIAIALRADAPVFIASKVMEEAGVDLYESQGALTFEEEETEEDLPPTEPKSELEELEEALVEAIKIENYEQAAVLRDEIDRVKKNS